MGGGVSLQELLFLKGRGGTTTNTPVCILYYTIHSILYLESRPPSSDTEKGKGHVGGKACQRFFSRYGRIGGSYTTVRLLLRGGSHHWSKGSLHRPPGGGALQKRASKRGKRQHQTYPHTVGPPLSSTSSPPQTATVETATAVGLGLREPP